MFPHGQVFRRLNRLGVCLSHSRTIDLIKDLGTNHDATVKQWKHRQEILSENQGGEPASETEELLSTSDDEELLSDEECPEFTTGIYT